MMENNRPLLPETFYENEYVTYQIVDDVLVQTYKNTTSHLTLPIAKRIVTDRQRLTHGKPMLHLSVLRYLQRADSDAMQYFGSDPLSLGDVLAGCLVINNWVRYTIVMTWIFAFRSRMQFPLKVSRSEQEGMHWLKQEAHQQKSILDWH